MLKKILLSTLLVLLSLPNAHAQSQVTLYPDTLLGSIGDAYQFGVFYVPKTQAAQDDFLNNGYRPNAIRLHIVESALNNAGNLNDCLALLDTVAPIIQAVAAKTDRLIFIFEKMPPWLSSSSDGSPAAAPGWSILNTQPPADYQQWEGVVSAITQRLVNTYAIDNASFEIWNEPDLGSWTGTEAEYFTLFKRTYNAIKSVNASIPVGGPAVNYWGNHIFNHAPKGYLDQQGGNTSLIAALIDSSWAWNQALDFLSWHLFDLGYQAHANAETFIRDKYAAQNQAVPDLIISEWNAPSVIRDTPLHPAFVIKKLQALSSLGIQHNLIAAWQDFAAGPSEFHGEYGLLTYGALHKPAYQALKLAYMLKGQAIALQAPQNLGINATLSGDTLQILLSNYAPPPLVAALYHSLFEGQINVNDLDAAGFIDILNNDLSRIDSIYRGLLSIPGGTPVNDAVLSGIPVYARADTLSRQSHRINLNLPQISGLHPGQIYLIDSTHNNPQYRYDSLLANGYSSTAAVTFLLNDQGLDADSLSFQNGSLQLDLQANAVCLLQFKIPELLGRQAAQMPQSISIFPNPVQAGEIVTLQLPEGMHRGSFRLLDPTGKVCLQQTLSPRNAHIRIPDVAAGLYLYTLESGQGSYAGKLLIH